MKDALTTRRRFLVAAITFSTIGTGLTGPSWLATSAAWADTGDGSDASLSLLAKMTRHLFPHDRIPDSVYGSVMNNILATAAGDPGLNNILHQAEDALNSRQDTSWYELSAAEQLNVLKEIQNDDFFAVVRETVRGNFYYHPDVWKYLDYPGSSKEFGGYIHRGFDDIDWLPEGN
jgi:hypothetical protein